MTTVNLIEGSDLTIAAKNIRKELAAWFPRTKFSVRTSRFSGGDAIDVAWTDGPTVPGVKAIVDKYQDGDFDGMTDSYNYRQDGWTRKHGGAKYVQTQRSDSPEAVADAIEAIRVEYGAATAPSAEDYDAGRCMTTSPVCNGTGLYWSWQGVVGRKLAETAR